MRALYTVPRRFFNWGKAVYPYSPASTTQLYKTWDGQIKQMINQTEPMTPVESIDWAYWENEIKTPGVVQKLKEEYESHKFKELEPEFLEEFNKKISTMLTESEATAKTVTAKIPALQDEVSRREWIRDNWFSMTMQEKISLAPGLVEELHERFYLDFTWFYPRERSAEQSLGDINEIRKRMANGDDLRLPQPWVDAISNKTPMPKYM